MLFGTNEFVQDKFQVCTMFGSHCLAIATTSRSMKQRRHIAHQGRNIEEKALAKHNMVQDLKIAQEVFISFCF